MSTRELRGFVMGLDRLEGFLGLEMNAAPPSRATAQSLP